MSPYSEGVASQYLSRLQEKITAFAHRYDANPSDRHTTIFLFPGGFASQLVRAQEPAGDGPPFAYDPLWLTCSFLFDGAKALRLSPDGDSEEKYILPDGYVDFVALKPYGGFAEWCEKNWLDLFVVGWDWRRPASEAADFFLQTLLPAFENGVARCHTAPLDNFWIVGHSFGGIVAKHVLNRADDPYVRRLKGAITVGTPFYGYGGQLHRFFVGDPDLNVVEGLNGAAVVTEIGSTLPASYELMFLDSPTYDANAGAFKADPEGYALTEYPCMDADAAGKRADPYNPSPGKPEQDPAPDDHVRYLPKTFDWSLLAAGHQASGEVSKPLDPAFAAKPGQPGKLWNIRGVQTEDNNPKDGTVVSQTWRRVCASYAPDPHRDPITDAFGPGDGVIAAWSAHLVGNPQIVTIADDQVDHMDLMSHRRVQEEIAHILAHPDAHAQMVATARTAKIPAGPRDALDALAARLGALKSNLTSAERKFSVRTILNEVAGNDPDALHALHARAFVDALKSPSQKLKRDGG